jgi:hypothetical protein
MSMMEEKIRLTLDVYTFQNWLSSLPYYMKEIIIQNINASKAVFTGLTMTEERQIIDGTVITEDIIKFYNCLPSLSISGLDDYCDFFYKNIMKFENNNYYYLVRDYVHSLKRISTYA